MRLSRLSTSSILSTVLLGSAAPAPADKVDLRDVQSARLLLCRTSSFGSCDDRIEFDGKSYLLWPLANVSDDIASLRRAWGGSTAGDGKPVAVEGAEAVGFLAKPYPAGYTGPYQEPVFKVLNIAAPQPID